MAITTAQIQQLYVAYLGRAADKAGLDYWNNQLNATPATLTLENLRSNFVNEQAEYKDAYAGLSRSDTVIKIYNNLFGRAPDAEGLTYWTTGGGAAVSPDQLLTAFINGASADDAKVITNKVLVSEVYTSTAGTNYLAADAKSILSGVGADGTSVGNALNKLTDGSLSGLAIPVALANLKASVAADAALKGFETSKATDLLALEKQLVALSKADGNIVDQTADSTEATPYTGVTGVTGVSAEVKADLAAARVGLGSTKDLTAAAVVTADALIAARATLTSVDKASVDHVTAYTNALAALKAAPAIGSGDEAQAVATLAAFGANAANTAAWTKALSDAGITASAATTDASATAQAIYDALTNTSASAAVIANTKTAFGSVTNIASVTTISDKDLAHAKADLAVGTAAQPLNNLKAADGTTPSDAGTNWIAALSDDTTAQGKIASSKALDALDSAYKVIDDAHTALTTSQSTASGKLVAGDVLVDNGTTLSVTPDDTKAEIFYFAKNVVTGSDGTLTLAAGGDSLYIGEGYTLNKSATLGATGIAGADNNAKEVFFFKDGANVKAVIETTVIGSTDVGATLPTSGSDQVAVITLTGVTDVSQVTFANGVISHVA